MFTADFDRQSFVKETQQVRLAKQKNKTVTFWAAESYTKCNFPHKGSQKHRCLTLQKARIQWKKQFIFNIKSQCRPGRFPASGLFLQATKSRHVRDGATYIGSTQVRWVSSFAIQAIVLRNLLFDARSWHVGTLGKSCVHAKLVLFRSLENPPDGCCKALGAVEESKPSEREMLCCSCKSSVKSEHSKSCQSQVHPRLMDRRFCLSDLQEEQRRTAGKLSWSFPSGALFLCLV